MKLPILWGTWTQDKDLIFTVFLNFYGPLEFNSRKICQHLTKWTRWRGACVGSVSRTTFAWSMFKRTRYIHVYRFFCIMAERTKPSIHARYTQRSFPFLAERWCKTFTNGTLAKRPVTGPREAFSLFPRVLMFTAVFLAMFIGIPSGSLCGVEWGERAQHRIFFLPPWRDLLVDVSQALRFDERLAIETPLS